MNHPRLTAVGIEINFKDKELVSLTNLWKATGSIQHKLPGHWLENKSTQEFIEQIQAETRYPKSDIIKTVKGKGKVQGTYARWKIGLAYTEFSLFSPPHLHS